MLQLSRTVIRLAFEACKHHNIDLVSLNLSDLNSLIPLLADEKNYVDLEVSYRIPATSFPTSTSNPHSLTFLPQYLLTRLWSSRHQQTSWTEDTVLAIGRALVQSRYLHGHHASAITLAEDIAYNLRRTKGSLHPATLDTYILLSELYTAKSRHRDAMGIHEEILRLVLYDADSDDNEYEGVDEDVGQAKLAGVVKTHLGLLKGAFARQGG